MPPPTRSLSPRRAAARATDRLADALARRLAVRLDPAAAATVTPDPGADREQTDNTHLELLLGWMLREDSNCIDVGANEGRFLWHMTQRAPRGRHLAFEPLPDLAQRLRETYSSLEVHEAALSNRSGTAEFVRVPDSPGYSGLRERTYPEAFRKEKITVQLERLDDVLPGDFAPHLIKVDVEGAEREVFEGAIDTLCRHRPIVAFEHGIGAANHYGTRPEQVWDLLADRAGLRIFDLDARGPFSRERFAEIFHRGERWNFVALP